MPLQRDYKGTVEETRAAEEKEVRCFRVAKTVSYQTIFFIELNTLKVRRENRIPTYFDKKGLT